MDLFILWSVQTALLDRYLGLVKALGSQHRTATQHQCNHAKRLEIKQEAGRRNPVMGKVLILNFM